MKKLNEKNKKKYIVIKKKKGGKRGLKRRLNEVIKTSFSLYQSIGLVRSWDRTGRIMIGNVQDSQADGYGSPELVFYKGYLAYTTSGMITIGYYTDCDDEVHVFMTGSKTVMNNLADKGWEITLKSEIFDPDEEYLGCWMES